MGNYRSLFLFILIIVSQSCIKVATPRPVQPLPNAPQKEWQEMEFYGFIHFSLNTFTDVEWGYGDKSPKLFNPTQLNARQWARIAKEAGMKGLILTDKHHDGFCLWPSKYTEYSIKNSPWKDGKGDVVKELAEACREYGLKMGVYLSPWDRNREDYGRPEYVSYFRNQLTELLTNYGDIFEVWFDGANGGDGYYGGANEVRTVDKKNYYDWENTIKLIRKLQPNCIIWSDAGPDARWVGNEHGFAYETTWSPLLKDSVYGGMPNYNTKYAMGQENGTHWVPAEADVSIRPSWYYHKNEDEKVKTIEQLLDIYYKSIGQNSTLLLNIPVDRRGLIHEIDEKQLKKLTAQLKEDFANNLTLNAKYLASNVRGKSGTYKPDNAFDGNKNTYWATDDDIIKASLIIDFKNPIEFNRFLIQEYIKLGQRVKRFSLDAEIDGKWISIANHTTIGYKRILRFKNTIATKIRLNIEDAKGCPLISEIAVYNAPSIMVAPKITRTKEGIVSIKTTQKEVEIYYTLNGNDPTINDREFKTSFFIETPETIKTVTYDPKTKRMSDVVSVDFDICKKDWKVINFENEVTSQNAIDDDINTNWSTTSTKLSKFYIDLGKVQTIMGFTYTPSQEKNLNGAITHFSFYGSLNGLDWEQLSKGEFPNIISNPIQQKILFQKKTTVKYIKLVADKIMNNSQNVIISEIGLLTE